MLGVLFFFQAEDGIRDLVRSRGLGDVYKRQLSLDPYMRGRMSDGPSYAAPVPIGGVMEGGTVCEVIGSNNPGFAKGDICRSTPRCADGWATGRPTRRRCRSAG